MSHPSLPSRPDYLPSLWTNCLRYLFRNGELLLKRPIMSLRRSVWQAILQTLRLTLFGSSTRRRRVPQSWLTPALVQPVESKVLLSGVTSLGPEQQVNTFTTGDQLTTLESRSHVAVDAQGNYVVTWTSYGQDNPDGGPGVYARRYDASGNPLSDEFRVNTHTHTHRTASFILRWR